MKFDESLRKKATGKLIRFYRSSKYSQTRDTSLLQKEFYKNQEEKEICSPRSFKFLEKGNILDDNGVYIRLVDKLGFQYRGSKKLDIQVECLFDKISHTIEYHQYGEIQSLYQEIDSVFEGFDDVIFYMDLKEMMHVILNIADMSYFIISDEFAKKIMSIADLLTNDIKVLFYSSLLMGYENKRDINSKYYKSAFRFLESSPINMVSACFVFCNTLHHHTNDIVQLICFCKFGLELANKKDNKYYLIRFNMKLGSICRDIGDASALVYYNEALRLADEYKNIIDQTTSQIIYLNIAAYYYLNQMYSEAITYYEKALELNLNGYPSPQMICLIDCYEQIGKKDQLLDLLEKVQQNFSKYPENIRFFFRYYILKYDGASNEKLINYITKTLHHRIKANEIFRDVLMDEMKRLVKETKSYKSFVDFYKDPNRNE